MNKVFALAFPMFENYRANSKIRQKIFLAGDNGAITEQEKVLRDIEALNDDKLDKIEELYDETFKAKEKIEDKAKTNIIGISISITLIMGASGMLSTLNNKYPVSVLQWTAFVLMLAAIIYMLSAGILVVKILTNENEVYKVELKSVGLGGDVLEKDYAKCILQNQNKNLIRNNNLFTSYECIRNSLVCLFIIVVMAIIPFESQAREGKESILSSLKSYSIMYSSYAVENIREYDVQDIVENAVLEAVDNTELNGSIQIFGIVEESNNLFIKFKVDDNLIEVLLVEPYIKM